MPTTFVFTQVFAIVAFFLLAAPLTHGTGELLAMSASSARVDVRHAQPLDRFGVPLQVDSTGVRIAGAFFELDTLDSQCGREVQNVRNRLEELGEFDAPLIIDASPTMPAWVLLETLKQCDLTPTSVWLLVDD